MKNSADPDQMKMQQDKGYKYTVCGYYREVTVVERWPLLEVPLYFQLLSTKLMSTCTNINLKNMVILRCETFRTMSYMAR